MKIYINKNTKEFAIYSNFTPTLNDNWIEVNQNLYNEIEDMRNNGYEANITIENNVVNVEYVSIKISQEELYRQELVSIQKWFHDNDWKINKIVIGEWTTEDARWITYLEERAIKRARQDELFVLLGIETEYQDYLTKLI